MNVVMEMCIISTCSACDSVHGRDLHSVLQQVDGQRHLDYWGVVCEGVASSKLIESDTPGHDEEARIVKCKPLWLEYENNHAMRNASSSLSQRAC